MNLRSLLPALAVAVVAGCSGPTSLSELPADHPAHSSAAEAPAPARSHTLRDSTTREETAAATQPSTAPVVYTCPHHPEVTSNEPGACPKCGMKLQPRKADAGNDPPAGSGDHGVAGQDDGTHAGHGGHGGH